MADDNMTGRAIIIGAVIIALVVLMGFLIPRVSYLANANISFSNTTYINLNESDPWFSGNYSSLAFAGNCPAGYVVQNTTNANGTGVECIFINTSFAGNFTENDTLQSVTNRGATTTNNVTVNSLDVTTGRINTHSHGMIGEGTFADGGADYNFALGRNAGVTQNNSMNIGMYNMLFDNGVFNSILLGGWNGTEDRSYMILNSQGVFDKDEILSYSIDDRLLNQDWRVNGSLIADNLCYSNGSNCVNISSNITGVLLLNQSTPQTIFGGAPTATHDFIFKTLIGNNSSAEVLTLETTDIGAAAKLRYGNGWLFGGGISAFYSANISDPFNPVSYSYPQFASSNGVIALNGNIAYVSTTINLSVLNISDPTNVTLISNCEISNLSFTNVYDIEYSGGFVYIAGRRTSPPNHLGVAICDVSNPAAPFMAGNYTNNTIGSANSIGKLPQGDFLVIGEDDNHVRTLNISNLSAITIADQLNIGTNPQDLYIGVNGNYTYWSGSGTLYTVNTSNPYDITLSNTTGSANNQLYGTGDRLYAGGTSGGLVHIISLVDADGPVVLQDLTFNTPVGANGVTVSATRLYASFSNRLGIANLFSSNMTNLFTGKNSGNDTVLYANIPEGFVNRMRTQLDARLDMQQIFEPSPPDTGYCTFYFNANDGLPYYICADAVPHQFITDATEGFLRLDQIDNASAQHIINAPFYTNQGIIVSDLGGNAADGGVYYPDDSGLEAFVKMGYQNIVDEASNPVNAVLVKNAESAGIGFGIVPNDAANWNNQVILFGGLQENKITMYSLGSSTYMKMLEDSPTNTQIIQGTGALVFLPNGSAINEPTNPHADLRTITSSDQIQYTLYTREDLGNQISLGMSAGIYGYVQSNGFIEMYPSGILPNVDNPVFRFEQTGGNPIFSVLDATGDLTDDGIQLIVHPDGATRIIQTDVDLTLSPLSGFIRLDADNGVSPFLQFTGGDYALAIGESEQIGDQTRWAFGTTFDADGSGQSIDLVDELGSGGEHATATWEYSKNNNRVQFASISNLFYFAGGPYFDTLGATSPITMDAGSGGEFLILKADSQQDIIFNYGADGYVSYGTSGHGYSHTIWDGPAEGTNLITIRGTEDEGLGSGGLISSAGPIALATNGESVAGLTDAPFWWELRDSNHIFGLGGTVTSLFYNTNGGVITLYPGSTGGIVSFTDGLHNMTVSHNVTTTILNSTTGNVTILGNLTSSYKSADGTDGFTGTCTILGLTSITVKNGIITGCT